MGRPPGIIFLVAMQGFISCSLVVESVALLAGLQPVGILPPEVPPEALIVAAGASGLIGFVGLCLVWGLWTGKEWAWTGTLAYSLLSILAGLISLPLSLPQMGMQVLILYVLTRPQVKAYCGKGSITGPRASWERLHQGRGRRNLQEPRVRCRRCGADNIPDAGYCQECGSILRES